MGCNKTSCPSILMEFPVNETEVIAACNRQVDDCSFSVASEITYYCVVWSVKL